MDILLTQMDIFLTRMDILLTRMDFPVDSDGSLTCGLSQALPEL